MSSVCLARATLSSRLLETASADSTRQLMCLGAWSRMGYVKDQDIKAVTSTEPELDDTGRGDDYEW